METFTFGNPNMFVEGVVDQYLIDPTTGHIVGYDKVGTDVAINYTFDLADVTGGLNNQLVMQIAHTTRLSGTYTSAAFSLAQRALQSGGTVGNNAIVPHCETVTASSGLTVTGTPQKAYSQPYSDTEGWCYVRPHGTTETYSGTNCKINLSTKKVVDYSATNGTQYDVFYFIQNPSAEVLPMSASAMPSIVSIRQRWAVYAAQGTSTNRGSLYGYLYVEVPRAVLTGDGGIDGNQTTNSTTSYSWNAIPANENIPECADCGSDSDNLFYYMFVPCGDPLQNVEGIAVVGGTVSVGTTQATGKYIPVVYVMKDGSAVQADYSKLTFTAGSGTGTFTISDGYVYATASGSKTYTVKITGSSPEISSTFTVTAS